MKHNSKASHPHARGFTMVELLVSLVILAILAALLLPVLTGYIEAAHKRRAESHAGMLYRAAQTILITDSLHDELTEPGAAYEYLTQTASEELSSLAGLHEYELVAVRADTRFHLIAFAVETDGYACYWQNIGGAVSWDLEAL